MANFNEKEIKENLKSGKAKTDRVALEALNDIFHRIPFGEKVTLSDGRVGTIKPFFVPRIMEKEHQTLGGKPCAGIDIVFDNGHIEFILYQSGWGQAL